MFQTTFMQILDKHMPIVTIRTRIHQSPWVSNEFMSLIDLREYRARIYRKSPTLENKVQLNDAKKTSPKTKKEFEKILY